METIDAASGPNPAYKWKPLDLGKNEFRILELHKIIQGEEGDVLSVSVHNESMSAHRPYHALSYAWGDQPSRRSILLNGCPHRITENLYEALCVLRKRGVQHIWVDALCIDQNDPDEKSIQVGRMATIFQEAETVDVWLGSASPGSDEMIDFMRNVDLSKLDQELWIKPLFFKHHVDIVSRFRPIFNSLFRRDYWMRLWVAQEIAMASNIRVHCGSECLDGNIFESLFSQNVWAHAENIRSHLAMDEQFFFQHVVHLWGIRAARRSRQPIHLLSLMFQLRQSRTTESVDRVYAISGLTFDQRTFIAEPDYNLQPEKLCALMTQRFIKATGSLDIILLATLDYPGVVERRNSWVCPFLHFDEVHNWDYRLLRSMAEYLDGKQQRLRCGILGSFWQAANSTSASGPMITLEEDSMKVLGLRLGTINGEDIDGSLDSGGDAENDGDTPFQSPHDWEIEAFESLCRLLLIHSPSYSDSGLLQQVAVRLFKDMAFYDDKPHYLWIILNLPFGFIGPIYMQHWELMRKVLIRGIAAVESEVGVALPYLPEETMDDAIQSAQNVLDSFNLAVLINSKHPAFLQWRAQGFHGPLEVWLLSGLSWPVVLRPGAFRNGAKIGYELRTFGLVDSAEVRGKLCRVMDGEAWRTATEDDLEWVTLV